MLGYGDDEPNFMMISVASRAVVVSLLGMGLVSVAQQHPRSEAMPVPVGAALPAWPRPHTGPIAGEALSLRSQELEILHSATGLGVFVVCVAGRPLAVGQDHPMVGYVTAGELRWFDLSGGAERKTTITAKRNAIEVHVECRDTDGGRWEIEQQFTAGHVPGTIDVETAVSVDADRAVAFLSMLALFPGAGTFGSAKSQGLFAGLEYLENEPSSSEADVVGPASKRQVPDSVKLTFPLMAIQHQGGYLGITWQMRPQFSAVFDSPDRLFGSGGHVMGLLFPGSDGKNRQEGSLLPKMTATLRPGVPLRLRATLLGGRGTNVVAAVQQYVSLRPLPTVPPGKEGLPEYVALASGGWLDSKIREGELVRHAILGGNFPPGKAADAAMWMDWLGDHSTNSALNSRLREVAAGVLRAVPPPEWNFAGIGHVRYPSPALLYGNVEASAAGAERQAQSLLRGFGPDGSITYHPRTGGPDYGKTHSTNEANGLTARSVVDLLEAAAYCGDRELITAGLRQLRAMDKFRNGVPRGAQTWECPLHTPDILASALMVRAYTLGYELSGEPDFLAEARYWAWTGVPFVYLVSPAEGPVGPYATIAVLGATQWEAPVWMGLPVQWCGLVYAEALYRLVRHDPKGPWKQLADGIALSGIRQTWPLSHAEARGLLPDSFVLRTQQRNGPAINPATVEACAVRYFGQIPVYDFWSFRVNKVRVHAPGGIEKARESKGKISFVVGPAFSHPCYVLINGLTKKPELTISGKKTDCASPHEFLEKEGRLILRVEGKVEIEMRL
jgi:hypothetical protein